MPNLFDTFRLGQLQLPNRVVMAPLTRSRAKNQVPGDLAVEYYRQRASAGLIVAEGSQVCPEGQGYLDTPGIHTDEHVAAWRRVTDAVHQQGGHMAIQLWHVGRISHVDFQPGGVAPVSSTAKPSNSKTYNATGFVETSAPRALCSEEIPGVVAAFAHGARCAIEAGFDAVEIHGANGYLIEQFLRDTINDRTDAYGGSMENRLRFALEVVQAVVGAVGAHRTGIRLSPVTPSNGAGADSQVQMLHNTLVERLAALDLAFIHVIEGQTGGPRDVQPFDYAAMRGRFQGAWILNNGYTADMAREAIESGRADAIAFGKPFISNPDLVRRFKQGLPLQSVDMSLLYGGDARGYTDYPASP